MEAAPISSPATGAPVTGWATGPLGEVQAADREIARQAALRARAVAEFAMSRPASADRPPGQPGAMSEERRAARADVLAGVSEWAAQELVVALEISSHAAEALLARSLTLVHRLPRTLAALEAGALHVGHLWPLLTTVAPITDAKVRAEVEEELLAWARGRVTTPGQLGAKARRVVLRRDARNAAGRLARAVRQRGMSVRPDTEEGMAVLSALLTVPEARALLDALGRYADALDPDPDDRRTRGQKMADCLLDLVLRPGENDLAPVRAQLTVVAGIRSLLGGDEPGEIGGEVVPADVVRALARALGLLPASTAPAASRRRDPTEEDTLADWWAATEARVLDEWGGADAPPPEEMARFWAQEERWNRWREGEERAEPAPSGGPGPSGDPGPSGGPGPSGDPGPDADADGYPRSDEVAPDEPLPGTWLAADRAVDAAGAALLDLQRAVGRAARAVSSAELTDATDEGAWQRSPAGRAWQADDALAALRSAADAQRAALADLLSRTGGGGLVDRPRIAVVDELTGALLALTDGIELRRLATCGDAACRRAPGGCDHDLTGRPGLGPPATTEGYRPGARLDRFVRARDRRCRFPGCRRRVPLGGELDHNVPWPQGTTGAGNLTGFCTGHHRGKHQAPGWAYDLARDGTLTVTTPTRLVASTAPPPY